MILEGGGGGGSVLKNQFQGGGGGGSVLKNQFEGGGGGGGSELSDQLLDPDVPTLASQDKLKVSPKGLPFVIKDVAMNSKNLVCQNVKRFTSGSKHFQVKAWGPSTWDCANLAVKAGQESTSEELLSIRLAHCGIVQYNII